MQTQNDKYTLICTFEDCKEIQGEDGEFCEDHTGYTPTIARNNVVIMKSKRINL